MFIYNQDVWYIRNTICEALSSFVRRLSFPLLLCAWISSSAIYVVMLVAPPIFVIPYLSLQELPYDVCMLFFSIMVVWCHQMCIWSDPGWVKKVNILSLSDEQVVQAEQENASLLDDSNTPCLKCNISRPPKCHHCSQCNQCVLKMDHHCPFINNCVGLLNQKHFILLNVYGILMQLSGVALWVHRFSLCRASWFPRWSPVEDSFMSALPEKCFFHNEFSVARKNDTVWIVQQLFSYIGLSSTFLGTNLDGVVTGLFHDVGMSLALAIMVSCGLLLSGQLSSVIHDQTPIDRLQGKASSGRTFMESLADVMGCEFCWKWFVPVPISHSQAYYAKNPKPWVSGDTLLPPKVMVMGVASESHPKAVERPNASASSALGSMNDTTAPVTDNMNNTVSSHSAYDCVASFLEKLDMGDAAAEVRRATPDTGYVTDQSDVSSANYHPAVKTLSTHLPTASPIL
eukprot:gene56-44_t